MKPLDEIIMLVLERRSWLVCCEFGYVSIDGKRGVSSRIDEEIDNEEFPKLISDAVAGITNQFENTRARSDGNSVVF